MEKSKYFATIFKSKRIYKNLAKKKGGFIAQFLAVIALAVIVLLVIVAIKNASFTSTASSMQAGYDGAIQKANNTISSVS